MFNKYITILIKESIEEFIINEGVGDKYLSRKGILPDEETEFNKYYDIKYGKDNPINMGEPCGFIYNQYNDSKPESKVFVNPKSLKNFEPNVRAISDDDGNLFIGQLDGNYYHQGMSKAVNKDGKYYITDPYDEDNYITWHRIGKTNDFGYSISYKDFAENPDNINRVNEMIDAANRKNPQFNFINRYWLWD